MEPDRSLGRRAHGRFLERYPPELIDGKEPKYVYMETPNGDYYTGYYLHLMRHPQTLLVTEMMGAPLTQDHGAPLRLHMPTKYGYKQIKRIGLISYTNDRPDDYPDQAGVRLVCWIVEVQLAKKVPV